MVAVPLSCVEGLRAAAGRCRQSRPPTPKEELQTLIYHQQLISFPVSLQLAPQKRNRNQKVKRMSPFVYK